MGKLAGIITFIVCVPLIGSILIRPQTEDDTDAADERFEIAVREDVGTFYYKPEDLTGRMVYRVLPEDAVSGSLVNYVFRFGEVMDPAQEYLKALAIVCRSAIVSAWEAGQCPDILDYDTLQFGAACFYKISHTDSNDMLFPDSRSHTLNEIKQAVDATRGAVITKDGAVMAAPFFTTTPSDMLIGQPGNGAGFSLNYARGLAVQGMDFYEILQYFYGDVSVIIYE